MDTSGTTTTEAIVTAIGSMKKANKEYREATIAMKLLEDERTLLIGPPWDADRVVSTVKKYGPKVLGYGSLVAGSGGLTALSADPGAFSGLLSALTSAIGGG